MATSNAKVASRLTANENGASRMTANENGGSRMTANESGATVTTSSPAGQVAMVTSMITDGRNPRDSPLMSQSVIERTNGSNGVASKRSFCFCCFCLLCYVNRVGL